MLQELSKLRGIIDLEKVVVFTGFTDVSPWGSSCTRWKMEAKGEFTIEGCIEMAWIMGFIKHFHDRLKNDSFMLAGLMRRDWGARDDKDVCGCDDSEKKILKYADVRLIGEFA
jgi:fatty acid synthase subunit alpha